MVNLLVAYGANPWIKDANGKNFLDYAGERGNDRIVRLLADIPEYQQLL